MKSSPRILLFACLIGCLVALPATRVQASPQSASIPNPAAEEYLFAELRATGIVDLKDNFPEKADRVISGDSLVSALKDSEVQKQPVISVANATIVGDLWASDLVIPANIDFRQMEFEGLVNFDNTQLQTIIILESTFHDSLSIQRATIAGSADLRDNVINGSLNFYGTYISGELLADGTHVLGVEPMEGTWEPVELWSTTVDGPASFIGAYFEGQAYFGQSNFNRLDLADATFKRDASFSGTTVENSADFSNARFLSKADFKGFYVGNVANFKGATFNGDVTFESATAVRQADFSDATFNGTAIFDYFTAERFMDFMNTKFNQRFSFYYTTVSWPYFDNVDFNGPASFEGMQASEDFEITNSRYNCTKEPLFVSLAIVEGAVKFKGITAPAGLQLSQNKFGSLSINTGDNPNIGFIDLTGTDIAGQFIIDHVNTKRFFAEGASIGKSTTLTHTAVTEILDLRNAHIGFLKIDDQLTWPDNPDAFNLRGMTYTDIDLGDQGLTEETWQGLLLLVNQSAYSPQAYEALAQFLTDKGHPDWAAEVELAQKRRERNEVLAPLSGPWFWSWFMDIFAGYGQRPVFAFGWSGLVIAIGAFVFRRKEDMCPVDQGDAPVEYNPIWYSFSLFLPYIDLGIASKWEPCLERKWARNYKYIHMMLGWILAPIALLTFGGIIG